jgi:hypothetical protein
MAEHTLFPSLIPDSEDPFVDDSYSKEELERKDRPELQRLASKHPNEDVHGKMKTEEIIEGLTGEERINE